MAIYHFSTKIIKSSIGKCAVASAAYISGEKLRVEKFGKSFDYTRKEEVVFSEIILPENAPEEFKDRQTLWNAVEKKENKYNSQYARMFEIAVPNEWSRDETIVRVREFIQVNFVDEGMVADWAYHEKEGNHHVHCMCTMRAFNKDGSWSNMRKSEYAKDENGNKIPLLDENGNQKVRIRKGKGEEKLWKRIDVIQNVWNSRTKLKEWRKNWADYCNQFLMDEDKIDHRSFEEQGLDIKPTIHEGYAARQMEERGKISERCQYNREVKETNKLIMQIKEGISEIANMLKGKVEVIYERIGRIRIYARGDREGNENGYFDGGTRTGQSDIEATSEFIDRTDREISRTEQDIKRTESAIAEFKRRVKEEGEKIDDRIRKIKEQRALRLGRRADTGSTAVGIDTIGKGSSDTADILRQLEAARSLAESIIADSESSRDNKVAERENRELERKRPTVEEGERVIKRSR